MRSSHFRKFQNLTGVPVLAYICTFFYFTHFNRNKLWYPPKCMPFALFLNNSPSCVILVLSSAVTHLPNKTLIFHDFQGLTIKFHDFPGLENEILKFHNFPGFP